MGVYLELQCLFFLESLCSVDWLTAGPLSASWLLKDCSQNNRKVFFCLLLKDWLNTRNLLKHKNISLEDYNCVLCNNSTEESLHHLFLECPFAMALWNSLGLIICLSANPFKAIVSFRNQLNVPFFMEVIISMCWAIWSVLNDTISLDKLLPLSNLARDTSGPTLIELFFGQNELINRRLNNS